MPFVQPYFLYLAAGVAIPIVVHLMFRRRSRVVSLGTLRFLKVVLHENARRRRLKQLALLMLRISAVVLLAAMFARPYLPALASGTAKDRLLAILIDRSASMQVGDSNNRLLDQAIAAARTLIGQADRGTEVQTAFFDHAVHAAKGPEHGEASARLEAPPAFGATNYGAALAWARDVCVKATHARKEVHLYTDLQQSGLDWSSAEPLPGDIDLHLHDLGRTINNNVAIVGVRASRSVVHPGETATLQVSVLNGGPFPLEKLPVSLVLQGPSSRQTLRQSLSLEPGVTGTVDLETPPLAPGLWHAKVRIEVEDEVAFDNERHAAVLSQDPFSVIVVDGDSKASGLLSETYFLEAALRLAPQGQNSPESPFSPTVVRSSDSATLPDLADARVVILANVARLPAADAERLARFVQAGGGLVVFTGENAKEDLFSGFKSSGLSPGGYIGQAQTSDLPWRLSSWNEDHPLFQPFNDPQTGDLRRLAFRAYTRIEASVEGSVLARFQNEEPALVETRLGKGKALWCLTACDRDWGDWPRSRLFVPFVHQALGSLTGLTGGGPVREMLLDTASPTAADAPGVYQREEFHEVVNVSPRESEMERCQPEDFARRFEVQLKQNDKTDKATSAQSTLAGVRLPTELRDDEAWPWLNVALLLVMLGEVFLANRTMV